MLQSIFVLDERWKLLRIVPLRRGQIYIRIKGYVPSGQEYTQLTLQLVREGRRHFLILEGNCNQKLFLIWFTWYMFQTKLGPKHDSFVFIVLLLESLKTRGLGLFLLVFREPLIPGDPWQGSPCLKALNVQESLRRHYVNP